MVSGVMGDGDGRHPAAPAPCPPKSGLALQTFPGYYLRIGSVVAWGTGLGSPREGTRLCLQKERLDLGPPR